MRSFEEIRQLAAERKGGNKALAALMPKLKSPAALKRIPDDRWLAGMTRAVFQAGFSWKVIETKWPGFEAAFHGFDVARCANLNDEDMDRLLKDKGIVRNGVKIRSVIRNAVFIQDLAAEYGSAGKAIGGWPNDDFIGLLEMIKKRGDRLGGTSAQFFLRQMGRDGFAFSKDMVAALIREGVVTKSPTSKRDLAAVQAAFNTWAAESGQSLAAISRTLACSIDG